MSTNLKSDHRWALVIVYMGGMLLALACMTLTAGFSNAGDGNLRIDNGIIKVLDSSGDLIPVAGASTFELVGELESMAPWSVAGRSIGTNESTQVEAGLQVGNLVRVRGTIPADDTWLAYSIESAQEDSNRRITFIGTVTSTDPWVVNGITLNVTGDTVIEDGITPGMLVRVEILLLDDGTWEVISIAPLGDPSEAPGCATVVATVASVNGNLIQFLGWPTTVTLVKEEGNETDGEITVSPGQVVLAMICVSDGDQVVIVQITILDDEEDDDTPDGNEKVLICHKPNKKGGHTLSISSSAVPAHLGHGDTLGPCP